MLDSVSDPLRRTFAEEVGCREDAEALAKLARDLLTAHAGFADDSPEDLTIRLRDPRTFGAFAAEVLRESSIRDASKVALAEHAFDLLPLPRMENDVILVESRAPPRLLALAAFLADRSRLTVLHVMHLLFAVFLDRSLVTGVERRVRGLVLGSVVVHSETPEPVRLLYASLHLASVPEAEAHATLAGLLKGGAPDSLKAALASVAAASDGGVAHLVAIAREEGLLTSGLGRPLTPSEVATIPRLPPRLAALGRRWLSRIPDGPRS